MSTPSSHDTRNRILDVALELFSECGFEATSLQQIAGRLGVTKAAVYHHFRSKDDILDELLRPAITGIDDLLDAHEIAPGTPAGRRQFMQDYLDYLLSHRRIIAYISTDLAARVHLAPGHRLRRARLEAMLLGTGELDFNEQVRVATMFGGVHAVIAQYPSADDEELRKALRDVASQLLRPRPHRSSAGRRRPRQPTAL